MGQEDRNDATEESEESSDSEAKEYDSEYGEELREV